jgi:hypothetical protein
MAKVTIIVPAKACSYLVKEKDHKYKQRIEKSYILLRMKNQEQEKKGQDEEVQAI